MTAVSSGNVVRALLGPSCQLRGRVSSGGRGRGKKLGGVGTDRAWERSRRPGISGVA